MGKIKGWKKETTHSWRNDVNSNIVSYRYVPTMSIPYRIIIGKTIQDAREFDSTGSIERAKKIIFHYMRTHPNG